MSGRSARGATNFNKQSASEATKREMQCAGHGLMRRHHNGTVERVERDKQHGCPYSKCNRWFASEQLAMDHYRTVHVVRTQRVAKSWQPPWAAEA